MWSSLAPPLLLLLLMLLALSRADSVLPSAEVSRFLEQHGLPGGLLPDLVTDYVLRDDNSFVVHLERECYHRFDNLVWYGTTITGKLSYGRIDGLSGIQAEEFFVWFGVTGIRVEQSKPGFVFFDVGFLSKKLKASLFQEPPSCSKSIATI